MYDPGLPGWTHSPMTMLLIVIGFFVRFLYKRCFLEYAREGDGEAGAFGGSALHGNGALVAFDNTLADG